MSVGEIVIDSRVAAARDLFIAANGATRKETDPASYTSSANPSPHDGLQRVVVSKLSDARENLAQAFENAWTTVFSSAGIPADSSRIRARVSFTGSPTGMQAYASLMSISAASSSV